MDDPALIDGPDRVSLEALVAERRRGTHLVLPRVASPESGELSGQGWTTGMQFVESRAYQPGDDARRMDWRVMARTGRPHTKVFREDPGQRTLVLVDLSPGMFFATRGCFKAVVAARMAAMIGWAGHRRGHRLGGMVLAGEQSRLARPVAGRRHLLHWLGTIAGHPAWSSTSAEDDLPTRVPRWRDSLVVMVSDFHAPAWPDWITRLGRGNRLVAVHVHDPLEAELPRGGRRRLATPGGVMALDCGDPRVREAHAARFRRHAGEIRSRVASAGGHYLACATTDDPFSCLARGLPR